MTAASFSNQIRELISRDELEAALTQLRQLLEHSPRLNEVILQTARFSDIRRQIRLGLVNHQEANLTQNQIRAGLLDLLQEIEAQSAAPALKGEIEKAVSIVNNLQVQGNQNIIIQGVSDSTITVTVNGETKEIHRRLDELQALLEKLQVHSIRTADKIYNIGDITNANFEYIVGQSKKDRTLPEDLAQNLITDENLWVKSLQQELIRQGVSVGSKPWAIFQHYGWLIEAFLQKMGTEAGRERSLRRLAFMAEAYQSTLRYLCYIQLAQVFQRRGAAGNPVIAGFIRLDADRQPRFDYLNLLLLTTELLPREQAFMPELHDFTTALTDTHDDLYGAALFSKNTETPCWTAGRPTAKPWSACSTNTSPASCTGCAAWPSWLSTGSFLSRTSA